MDIEVNDNKQQASFRNGKFYHTFTPTTANQTVKLYHMGCVGDTRLNRIQLEQGTEPTGFVIPKQSTNSISGIFKNLRDLDVMMKDPTSDFWSKIKKNARGTVEEYHTSTLSNEIVRTAEGIVERQTKTINTSVDEKIDGIRTQIDTVMNKRVIALTSESKRYADGISETLTRKIDGVTNSVATVTRNVDGVSSNLSRINSELARTISNVDQKADRISNSVTTLENNSLRKDEVSITSTGIQLGSGKVVDGRTISSILTTQPENIKAITDKFIITPANENLVDFEYRASAVSNERDLWLTPKIQDVNLEQGAEFIFDGSVTTQAINRHDIKFMIEIKTKDGNYRWYDTPIMNANTTRDFLNSNVTLKIPENITNIEYYRFGILQDTRSNFVRANVTLPKIYKKKSAELIVDGTIEGKHIKSSSIETGHLKAGSVTSNIIAADAITSTHLQVDDAMIRDLVSHNAFVTKLWAQKAFINKINAIKVTATKIEADDLQSYTGRIGNFILGEHWGGSGQWITGANNFSVGMSDGSWDRTALWVNWGSNWDSAGNEAWFVKPDGKMMCYNKAEFWNEPVIHGNLKVTGNIVYDNGYGSGVWCYSPIYTEINKSGNRLSLLGQNKLKDYINIDSLISDRRFKSNIKKSTVNALEVLNKFETYSFTRKYREDVKDIELGIMAQDVKEYMPEAFVDHPGGYYTYEPFEMQPYLIKAIQELSQQNKELQQRIIKMEEKING